MRGFTSFWWEVNSKMHFQGESHPFPLDNPGYWSVGSTHLLTWAVGTVLLWRQFSPQLLSFTRERFNRWSESSQLCRCFRSPKIQTAPENFELFPCKRSQEIWFLSWENQFGQPCWKGTVALWGFYIYAELFYFLLGCPAALQQTMWASGGSDSPCKFKSHFWEQGIHLRAEIITVSCRLSHPGRREGKLLAVRRNLVFLN